MVLELTKFIGLFSLNTASRITSTTKLLISSTATDKCFKAQRVIPRGPALEERVKEKATVVDSKFETLQRLVGNTTSFLCFNKSRCVRNRRGMDIRGNGNANKYFGNEGSQVSSNVISQTNGSEGSSFSN